MDFVEALPKVQGKSIILSVVDRFSKYAHFIPLGHPYTAESVAQAFFSDIVRLHGIPQSIVSDRDPVFTSAFWRELMRLMGTKLLMSSAFHPQTDGQSEAANRVIIMYLRCFTGDRPRHWLRWLPWAEYIYNTAFQSSLRGTPFRVVYGRDPPPFVPMSRATLGLLRSPKRWRLVRRSWGTSATVSSRRRRCRSYTTTVITGRCPLKWATGLSSASGSAPLRLCLVHPRAS
jgi:hypothetical protein